MMKSNITIRSNVFIRRSEAVKEDPSFLEEVRGKAALVKLLRHLAEGGSITLRNKLLTQRQAAELAWETPCAECGAVPEGPIVRNGRIEVVFRCPLAVCRVGMYRPRTVSLDCRIVKQVTTKYGLSLSELVQIALMSQDLKELSMTGQSADRRPFAVKLTPSQYHFLTDASIEAALAALISE